MVGPEGVARPLAPLAAAAGRLASASAACDAHRRVLMRELDSLTYLEPYKSESNFILCKVTQGVDAQDLKQKLQNEYGVMVRHYNKELLKGYVRISVGMPEQTQVLMAALRDIDDKR